MVASECWAHGVPVLSSARGALVDRVIPDVNGWLVPDMEPESWVCSLSAILADDVIEKCRERLSRHSVTSIEQSAETVHHLYQGLLEMPALPLMQTQPADPQSRFMKRLEALRSGTKNTGTKSSGSNCLGIVRDHWGTANYRVRFPLEDLARSGTCDSSQFHVIKDAGFQVAPALMETSARHVVVQPYLSDEGLRLMEFLHREAGFSITLVVDDLWTALSEDNPVRALMPDDVPGRLSYAASLSQSLVLTTHELRYRLGLHHDNIHVINNGLPEWVWGPVSASPAKQHGRLRIGWSGAPQHASDLAFLEQVMKNTADLADWVFLGMCPPALQALASEVHGMVPFEQYPAALSALNLDLAIAPLADHAFNRCKSNLKALEYGIAGLPVIASDLEPYRGSPVSLVSPDDAGAWTGKIRSLLENREERIERGRVLQRWVLDNHMTKHRRSAWRTALGINDIAD